MIVAEPKPAARVIPTESRLIRGILVSPGAGGSRREVVMPYTGCILHLLGPSRITIRARHNLTVRLDRPIIFGPLAEPVVFSAGGAALPSVAIAFSTLGARALFDRPMADYLGTAIEARTILPEALLERLVELARGVAAGINHEARMEDILAMYVALRPRKPTSLITDTIRQVEERTPPISSDGLANGMEPLPYTTGGIQRHLDLSERSVRRAIRNATGLAPKQYLSVARHQAVVRTLLRFPTVTMSALAVAFGYSDSAHFARDFRARALVPPSEFLTSRCHRFARRFCSLDLEGAG